MSLSIVRTSQERLVATCVRQALHAGIERNGQAVLLVPSFTQALEAQRELSREQGLALSVTTTTPSAWVKERWEVWGDGRSFANATALEVLGREVIMEATPEELGPIELSPGVVKVLASLVSQALPWLPLDSEGHVHRDICAASGLTEAETLLVGLAGKLGKLLGQCGYVGSSTAFSLVPRLLADASATVPSFVVAGFEAMARAERELVMALGSLTPVSVAIPICSGPAAEQANALAAWFEHEASCVAEAADEDAFPVERAEGLPQLLEALFTETRLAVDPQGPVELLLPAGPVAEAEMVARRVSELADGGGNVVVAVPDVRRARRELLPKLAARGCHVRLACSTPLLDCSSSQAFFAYAETVAHLAELAATWPEPAQGLEGPVAQLGDMSWWPPRELSDFLLSDIAHVGATRAWWVDTTWRGNRLLTPARILTMLQSESDTSPAVARATTELLKGRMGTAASKLLQPYVAALAPDGPGLDERADEARAVLQAILQLAGTLRELGVTADPSVPGCVKLSELVEIAQWAAQGTTVVERLEIGSRDAGHTVHVMGMGEASRLAPASVDAVLACGLTTEERPVKAGDELLQALLELLGVEPVADPMAKARSDFHGLLAAASGRVVLERAQHDADSKPTYPSVMLSELLATYGISATASYEEVTLPKRMLPETYLSGNLAPGGTRAEHVAEDDPAPAGKLTPLTRPFVFVPQDGSEVLAGGKPVLSASQIETYLDCPYKWFSLRRLRLGTVDAGHGGMEMGTFAHRVLEVTHRELLSRALEAEAPGVPREALLAQIEADPARHVAGSHIDEGSLDAARAALELEFDLHQQHMYMVKRPRVAQQLLVAHNASERAQEDQLRADLLSALEYETRILQGFEPRLFEWSFGRHGELVEYAGAYFTGTVDRIDVSPHGTAVIIDYKHKSPTGFATEYDALQDGVLDGELLPNRVQSLIYAQVVRRAFEGRLRLVGSVYLSTKSPHALAGVADENVVDLVFGRVSKQRLGRVSVPRTSEGESGMNALLDSTEELVAEQVRQMLAGNVEARPRDVHSCDFCPVMQCEKRMAR